MKAPFCNILQYVCRKCTFRFKLIIRDTASPGITIGKLFNGRECIGVTVTLEMMAMQDFEVIKRGHETNP